MSSGAIILLAIATLVAGTLSAVTGFGGAAILLPLLVAGFGTRDAVPILTVAQLIGNASRVGFNRHELNITIIRRFSLGAVPAAFLGAFFFVRTPSAVLVRLLGIFLIFVVVYRHLPQRRPQTMQPAGFTALGAAAAFLSALIGSVGPVMAPFFLAYGLTKGAYIGTEAAASFVMHAAKMVAYGNADALTLNGMLVGSLLGLGLLLGSYLGTLIVSRLSPKSFVVLVEVTLIVSGLRLLFG